MLETAPANTAFTGEYMVGTAANSIDGRRAQGDSINTTVTTTSGTYVTSSMPTVTVDSGATAFVFLFSLVNVDTNSEQAFYGYAVSDATTVAATDQRAITVGRFTADVSIATSGVFLHTGLTVGSNTFTAARRVTGGATGTFDTRRIAVMPF